MKDNSNLQVNRKLMVVEYIHSAQTVETHLNTESTASNILLNGMKKVIKCRLIWVD